MKIMVQVARTAFHGGVDLCLKPLDYHGQEMPAWLATAGAIKRGGHTAVIGCPPEDGEYFRSRAPLLQVVTAKTPRDRMLQICDSGFPVGRTDGINVFARYDLANVMLEGVGNKAGAMFPDDWPAALGFEVYQKFLNIDLLLHIDPGLPDADIHWRHYLPMTKYAWGGRPSTRNLRAARKAMATVYDAPRQKTEPVAGRAGDQLSLRYEVAAKYLRKEAANLDGGFRILDAGGGEGHGAAYLESQGFSVANVDLNPGVIQTWTVKCDLESLPREWSGRFDGVTCMDVIEHVTNDVAVLRELWRVTKPNGLLILSTPQNRLGHVPINASHVIEYTIEQMCLTLETADWSVEKVRGILAGRIFATDEEQRGTGMLVVARKVTV